MEAARRVAQQFRLASLPCSFSFGQNGTAPCGMCRYVGTASAKHSTVGAAVIVHDKFHTMQHANQAIDKVRRAEFFRKGGKACKVVRF